MKKTKIYHLPLCFRRHLRDKYKRLEDKSQFEKKPGMAQITSWTHGKSQEWDQSRKVRGIKKGFQAMKLLEATEPSLLMGSDQSTTWALRW